MGGGLMQLVAYGARRLFTGNPQITSFKVVYRRRTIFQWNLLSKHLMVI